MNFHFKVYLRQQEKKHRVNKSALSIPLKLRFTENDFQVNGQEESLKLTKLPKVVRFDEFKCHVCWK